MRKVLLATGLIVSMAALTACGSEPERQEASGESTTAEVTPAADAPAPENAATDMAGVSAEAHDGPPAAFTQCKVCHAVEPGKNGVGPSLAGVYGAAAGHVEGYAYSTPMRESGLTWDEATLDAYLKAPREVVPGTKMSFAGIKDDATRGEVVEYLETLK